MDHCFGDMTSLTSHTVVAGIDVGGPCKGFHAVALLDKEVVGTLASCDAGEVATWCNQIGATLVGVDAPICWSATGRARSAERALMKSGIWCFSTPSEDAARRHPKNHYAWMLNGAELYAALDKECFHRFNGENEPRPMCFETFPHAIACALKQSIVAARDKRTIRRALLTEGGIACDKLTNIDLIDAALCALTAEHFGQCRYRKHGDPTEGYILVPAR